MLENFWSTADIKKNFPLVQTLGQLVEAVSQWAQKSGRVICSVTVNGVKLREEEESKFSTMKTTEIKEFRIETQTPEILLDESLIGCQEHLVRLIEVYEKCAYLFRVQDLAYANRYHQIALTGIYHFVDLVNNYAIVYKSLRGDLNPQWVHYSQALPQLLDRICSAYEKKDYNLVADLLEYDLLDLLENWKKEISNLSDNAIKDGPSA